MITDKQLNKLPQRPGVYIFYGYSKKPIYIGKATNLNKRVKTYYVKDLISGYRTKRMLKQAVFLDYVETESEIEALLLEADLIKRLNPRFNVRLKDDKAYKYIKITIKEEFPRVLTTRKMGNDKAKYFGPFPEGKTVNNVLRTARKLFPYCNQKSKKGKPCFYYHLGLCTGPCANMISKNSYRKNIKQLVYFLSGKKKHVIKLLESEMKEYARAEIFDEAARLRDKINNIKYITQSFRDSSDYIKNPNLIKDIRSEEIRSITKLLNIKFKDNFRIEAYDISCISGKLSVGSLVVFIDGQIFSKQYRRFRIKSKNNIDDLSALDEVIKRRFKADLKNPDLILIDGGKGQLNVVLKSLNKLNLNIPTIAIAKRLEQILLPGGEILNLPKRSRALNLCLRIRDESHRFAKAYHLKLRKRSVSL